MSSLFFDEHRTMNYELLTEAQLRCFLSSGSNQLSKALLAPYIQSSGSGQRQSSAKGRTDSVRDSASSSLARWEVSCCGASIEELLARFAANADFDISWECVPEKELRDKPVNLYLSEASAPQFVTVAAGCVGLLARFDDESNVKIFNPYDYNSLSEHVTLLGQQAVSLWQRYLLTFGDDQRIPNAHFATGLLQANLGHINDAIAEYKLTANRYSRSSLAPFALLNSSKLKVSLRDYVGAREDLKQLIEQYPDSELSEQACLLLADVTTKAGLFQEAVRLYRKVYNLNLSLESQRASALGAGKCFYEEKDYESAAKWLTQYINSFDQGSGVRGQNYDCRTPVPDPRSPNRCTNRDFCCACLLLGKTYLALGKYEQACQAFQNALAGQLTVQEFVETLSALVTAHVRQGHLVEALVLLENTRTAKLDSASGRGVRLSQEESIEISLLKAGVLRLMGLVDEAVAILGDAAQYLPDSQLKAMLFLEQSKCFVDKGDMKSASKSLTEILVFVSPGPLACEARYELADICLKLGDDNHAISVCLQLLASEPEAALKQKALELLAMAYTCRKEYDKAALALLGQWALNETKDERL